MIVDMKHCISVNLWYIVHIMCVISTDKMHYFSIFCSAQLEEFLYQYMVLYSL